MTRGVILLAFRDGHTGRRAGSCIAQTELPASALDTAAPSGFAIGVATPIAGDLYNVGGLQPSLPLAVSIMGGFGWLAAAVGLHLIARGVPTRLQP